MFSYVAFKAANTYHLRTFSQTPSAQSLTPVIGFQKEWTNQKLKTRAEYFFTSSSDVFHFSKQQQSADKM